jgi:hemolysin activation/secretion protein
MRTKTIILTSLVSFLFCLDGLAVDAETVQTGSTNGNFVSKLLSRASDSDVDEKNFAIEDKYSAEFVIEGNTVIDSKDLYEITRDYHGRVLDGKELEAAANLITQEYWNRGYITSLAHTPWQNRDDGKGRIAIIEGRLGDVTIKHVNDNERFAKFNRFNDKFINRYLTKSAKESAFNNKNFERGLLLLNEYPTLDVTAALSKGKEPGTSDVVITAKEKKLPLKASVFVNNHGSRYTGHIRTGASIDIINPTTLGDTFSMMGTLAPEENSNTMHFYKFSYNIPVGPWGTKLFLGYSRMKYEIDKEFNSLGTESSGRTRSIGITHPFIKSRDKNLSMNLGLRKKNYTNYMFERVYRTSKDVYSALDIGVTGDMVKPGQHAFVALNTSTGLGSAFGGLTTPEYSESSRPGKATGSWTKVNLDVTYIKTLLKKGRLIARGSGQFATSSVVIGEQFSIGGPESVRGYGAGEFLGDHGYFVSAEVRTPFWYKEIGYKEKKLKADNYINWAFFIDHAQTFYEKELSGDRDVPLTSVGLGLRANALNNKFSFKLDLALPITGEEPSDKKDARVWAYMSLEY